MQGEERSHPSLTPAQRELEDALRGLRPAPARIDRDRLLFEAGVAAGRGRPGLVRGVAVALALVLGCSVLWKMVPDGAEDVASRGAQKPSTTQLAQTTRVAESGPVTSRAARGSLRPLPFPVPGGAFVPVPARFIALARADDAAGSGKSAYLTAIQGVLEKGFDALPRAGSAVPDEPRRGPSPNEPATAPVTGSEPHPS